MPRGGGNSGGSSGTEPTPQAELKLSGSPADIKDVLEKKDSSDSDREQPDVFKWLVTESQDVSVHVDRIHPPRWKGRDIAGFIAHFVPPITFDELQQKVKDEYGGGRYAVRIMVSGRLKTRRGFEIAGDPKLPDEDEDGDLPPHRGAGMYGNAAGYPPYYGAYGMPPGPAFAPRTPLITDINRDPEVIEKRKQMELIKIEREMKKLRADTDGAESATTQDKLKEMIDGLNKDWQQRFDEMKRFYERKEQENQIEKLRADFMATLGKLEDKMTANSNGDQGPRGSYAALKELKTDLDSKLSKLQSEMNDSLKSLKDTKDKQAIEEMQKRHEELIKEIRRDFETRIVTLSQQRGGMDHLKEYAGVLSSVFQSSGERDKQLLGQMFDFFKAQMTAAQPQGQEQLSDVDRFAQFLDIFASAKDMMGGGNGQVVEAAPKDFGTAFLDVVREAIPQIVDAAKAKQGNVSREEVENIIKHNMDVATKRAAANIANKQRQQLAAGTRQAQQPPQGLEDTQTTQPAPSTGAEAPSRQSPEQIALEAEAHRKQRLNILAKAIAKELPSRPRITRWVELALNDMPEDALDRFCQAPTVQEFLAVLRPDVDPGYITFIEQQIADPAKMRWLSDTIGILKKEFSEDKAEQEAEARAEASHPSSEDGPGEQGQATPDAMKQPNI